MAILDLVRFVNGHPLTRDRPIAALGRVARWQLRSRLSSGPFVHEWVGGARFLVDRGDTGLTGNLYVGLHEFEDMAFLLHALEANDLFIDVGANLGSYTLLAGVVARARTLAFEPAPAAFARLQENVDLNSLGPTTRCLNLAVGAREGIIGFTTARGPMNRVARPDDDPATIKDVAQTTLDTALMGETPSIIKIDVEGGEREVLAGASATLKAPTLRAVIVEVATPTGGGTGNHLDICHTMAARGFETCTYDPFSRRLAPARSTGSSQNVLFVRGRSDLEQRLRRARAFSVLGRSI